MRWVAWGLPIFQAGKKLQAHFKRWRVMQQQRRQKHKQLLVIQQLRKAMSKAESIAACGLCCEAPCCSAAVSLAHTRQ